MSAVKISTPRLESELEVLINWANDKDIEDSLKLLIDCSVIRQRIELLPTIINRLSTENCIESLSKWSKTNSYAFHLHRLIFNFNTDPPKLRNKNIVTNFKPAKYQLFGETEFFYLVGAVLEITPAKTLDEKRWFENFRLWLVVKAMHAAASQNLQDSYLRELFKYVRITADKLTDNKLNLINNLMVATNRYDLFTSEIERKAGQLIRDPSHNPNDRNFLNILIKICNKEFNPEISALIHPLYQVVNYLPKVADSQYLSDIKSDLAEEDPEAKLIEVSEEEDADIGIEVDIDFNQTPQLKILKGNSVLLSSISELQFLPWAWNNPNPFEIQMLLYANDQLLKSEKEDEQLLATLVWVALKTGRSFRRALNIEVCEVGDDWALNLKERKLVRKQPIRKNSWLPKSQEQQSWIIPIVETHEINLSEIIAGILNHHLSKSPHARYLSQLWDEKAWGSAESYFLEKFKQRLPRLTPGMLGNYLPQQIFIASENDKLTRILSSHPRTGLPPASAYSAWLKNEHTQVFNQFLSSSQLDEKNRIVAGSRLYPVESLLIEAVSEAVKALEKIRLKGDLIEYHNHLIGYLYTMLLAATGSRPINDLVESIGQFDFDNGYFYVDDKSTSRGNKGRLIAVPDQLNNFLKNDYLLHLRIIAQTIGIEKSSLATEIDTLSQGLHSDKIPFLFFLKQSEILDWESVSASKISNLGLFDWPLPSNLFRHRLAKLLSAEGIHQEIIDGLLGHIETGLETYGDFSTRSFLADTKILRPVLNKLFNKLNFILPRHQPYLKLNSDFKTTHPLRTCLFGSASRKKNRRARIVNAIKAARWELEKALGDTPFDLVDEHKMDELSRNMLLHANGLPRSDGFLRYGYLIKCINRFSRKSGKRAKLKKQYVFAETSSPFTLLSIRAQTKYRQIVDALAQVLNLKPESRFSATDTALLSPLIFSLENLVADKGLLIKAFMGTHFRIVQLQEQYYVEFSASDKIDTLLICARRFPITRLCAYWMQNAKELARNKTYLNKPVPTAFQTITNIVSDNMGRIHKIDNIGKLIQAFSEIINQANVVELPGILAGYLSGRVSSYSWSWFELIRFKLGTAYRLDFEHCLLNKPDSELTLAKDFLPATELAIGLINEEGLQLGVKELYKKVRETLTNEKNDHISKNKSREGLIRQINTLLNLHSKSVSQSCLLLVLWVKALIETKLTSSRYYAISTVERYFSALSTKFEVLAYATNLVSMDEEDITQLYSNILSLAKETDRAYVGQRLLGFHRWASSQGVDEPDWSEIEMPQLEAIVSPGFIFEEDYQNVLQLLTRSASEYNIDDWFGGLLLLLAYRFGLRGKEALGMLASDLVSEDDMMVVLVTDNRFRKLKSLASRRQVPLVFDLSECEQSIIDWCSSYFSSVPGASKNTPLFNHEGEPLSDLIQDQLKHRVISVLKQVSGNRDTTLHHARHTAANKIAHELFPFKTLYKDREFKLIQSSAAQTLLGTVAHTRREAWASARFLGHSTRSTQLNSYIHFIGDWSAQYSRPIKVNKRFEVEGVLDIGQYVIHAGKVDFQLAEKNQRDRLKEKVSLVDLIQLFRLLANGKKIESCVVTLGISSETTQYAYNLLTAVSSKSDRIQKADGSLGIFNKISSLAWKRLFEYLKTVNIDDMVSLDCREIDFEIERLLPMFGSRGHVLMRTDFQFEIMKAFIDIFQVHQVSFDALTPTRADNKLILKAEKYKFKPIQIGANTQKGQAYKGYQLDAYSDHLEGENFAQRCGLVFKQEKTGYARNTNHWILLIIIFITYLKFARTKVTRLH